MATDNFASLMTTAGGSDRARRRLSRGEVIDATVMQIASDFVFVDVGTPSDGRIPRVDLLDAEGNVRVSVGDQLRVSVVEPRFEGSLLKALGQSAPPGEAPRADEVLAGKVTRVEKFGVFVSTPRGDGLIPVRELPLPPGSDHRKLFPVGKELTVVVLDANAQGKLRFSATRVARVEEEQNFRDFSSGASPTPEPASTTTAKPEAQKKPPPTAGFGSLGDLMRGKFGALAAAQQAAPAAKKERSEPPKAAQRAPVPSAPAASPPAPGRPTERSDVIKRKR